MKSTVAEVGQVLVIQKLSFKVSHCSWEASLGVTSQICHQASVKELSCSLILRRWFREPHSSSSMSIRQGTLHSSWNLSFHHRSLKDSLLSRLSAIQVPIGHVVNISQRDQQVDHCWLFWESKFMDKSNSSKRVTFISRDRVVCHDSSAVESLALKDLVQEFDSKLFSRDIKIIVETGSSAGKTMASCLGISRRSKDLELRHP